MDRGVHLDAYKSEAVMQEAEGVPTLAEVMERRMAVMAMDAFRDWKRAGKPHKR